jgi:large subunit ribosomal protein L28
MSRMCEYCGKKTQFGQQITRRGLAKAKGGVGIKTTGVTKRPFKANIQKLRAEINGRSTRVRICTRCLKSGLVKKPGLGKKNQKSAAPTI